MKGRLTAGVWIALGFVAGLAVAAIGVVAVKRIDFFSSGLRFDTSQPTVVQQIRRLQRLESVVYAMDKIVVGGYENRFLPRMLAGDRLLLVVYGDVTAGVDLGHVEASGVQIDG